MPSRAVRIRDRVLPKRPRTHPAPRAVWELHEAKFGMSAPEMIPVYLVRWLRWRSARSTPHSRTTSTLAGAGPGVLHRQR
jgi:hypothetical protein